MRDCPVEGKIPQNLSGGFYAVGPDPMYPLAPGNIPFDGDGHVRLFRIQKRAASTIAAATCEPNVTSRRTRRGAT